MDNQQTCKEILRNRNFWLKKFAANQRGAVAIFVALSMAVMIGFAGLALDMGRLYVTKSELQSAADSCALAAAKELICDTGVAGGCPASFLQNAEIAGLFMAAKNKNNFQRASVTIAPADIKFNTALGPNSGYQPRGSASPNSKYAMCIARAAGITPWFMGVLGVGDQSTSATAVGTLAPGQGFCNGPPIGVCNVPGSGAPNFGYTTGKWIKSTFTTNGNGNNAQDSITGGFKWIDFTPNGGGNSEIRDQLVGNGATCNIRIGDEVQQPGQQQGAKSAYNTRFGIYPNGANAYTPQTAPPDSTGYAYPNKAPAAQIINQSTPPYTGAGAYADYRNKQNANTPFTPNQYAPSGAAGNFSGNPINASQHRDFGAERRIVAVPVINCGTGATTIVGMVCVLMLNPMSNGASGDIYLEFRGNAAAVNSPCSSSGLTSSNGNGPLVPTLVQ